MVTDEKLGVNCFTPESDSSVTKYCTPPPPPPATGTFPKARQSQLLSLLVLGLHYATEASAKYWEIARAKGSDE